MIRQIKLQQLPDDSFGFACLELADQLDAKLEHSKGYYERFDWKSNIKQLTFYQFMRHPLTTDIQHFYCRGSIGSGKSTVVIAWFFEQMDNYPGSTILVMRRTHAQLISSCFTQIRAFNERYNIPAEYKESKSSGPPRIRYKNGSSWVFWSSEAAVEKTTSDTARGLGSTEYSGAFLEEADMIHPEAVDTVPQRMREQSGMPVRLIAYVANPTVESHWLHKRFKNFVNIPYEARANYNELKFTMEDNRQNLPPGFIESQYSHYRHKPSLFRRMILGEPGPEVRGDPIYGPYFSRQLHVAKDSFIANWKTRSLWKDGPVCLSLDFGFRHPALVVWQDVQIGTFRQIRILGAWLGDSITLRVWMRYLLDELKILLPNAELLTFGDPAGKQSDGRGVTDENAFDVLKSLGLNPKGKSTDEAGGIDLIIELLKNVTNHPVLGIQPDIIIEPDEKYSGEIIAMFEVGFCQDPNSRSGLLKPFDDDYYIHLADGFRYGVVNRRSLRRPAGSAYAPHFHPDSDPQRAGYASIIGGDPYLSQTMTYDELEGFLGEQSNTVANYNFGR